MNIEEQAKEIASTIKAELGLDDLKKSFKDEIDSLKSEFASKSQDAVLKVFVAQDTQKAVNELTAEEKVKAFSHAIIARDTVALKALSEGVNADGGFTVPQDFYNVLLEEIREANYMRNEVNVVTMSTNVLTLSMIDNGPDVYWTAEGATKTTTTAEFTQPTITAYKLAAIIYMTDELVDDSAFDLTSVLVRRFAERLADAEERAIVAGTGTGQPTGIFTAATVATRTCAGNLSFDNIINLIYDLPVKARKNAKFIVHPNNVRELRLLKDSQGRYLWQEPVAVGQPATIQGYPVLENYYAPESQIAFGDYRQAYWLGDRQRVTVKITNDTETTFTQDKTAIRVVQRIGGTVVFPNLVRKLITIP